MVVNFNDVLGCKLATLRTVSLEKVDIQVCIIIVAVVVAAAAAALYVVLGSKMAILKTIPFKKVFIHCGVSPP